ncbi:MAG TPA: hypothetical protein VF746_05045 [Longimicrobium sp.]|jgi:hypothetical protein
MSHGHAADFEEARENRKTIFMGLGAALVWLLIVGGIAHFLARSMSGGEEGHDPAAAPAAATQPH